MAKKSKVGKNNPVNHPAHYTTHPSGIEAITICEHMSFCLGNVLKYIWRADLKCNALEDLEKAQWYLAREIWKRKRALRKQKVIDKAKEERHTPKHAKNRKLVSRSQKRPIHGSRVQRSKARGRGLRAQ